MIAVLTSPGRGYLAQTLAQADEGTAGVSKVLVSDGDPQLAAPVGWATAVRARPVAPPQNKWAGFEAFELAVRAGQDLLFLEDDVELATNAAGVMHGLEVPPELAFVSFFSPWMPAMFPSGLWSGHTNAFLMSQAVKFPLRTCYALAAFRRSPAWGALACGGFDEVIRHVGVARSWRYGVYVPGLVQHVGAVSLVGNGELAGLRVARNYVGRQVDAEQLRLPKEWYSCP